MARRTRMRTRTTRRRIKQNKKGGRRNRCSCKNKKRSNKRSNKRCGYKGGRRATIRYNKKLFTKRDMIVQSGGHDNKAETPGWSFPTLSSFTPPPVKHLARGIVGGIQNSYRAFEGKPQLPSGDVTQQPINENVRYIGGVPSNIPFMAKETRIASIA